MLQETLILTGRFIKLLGTDLFLSSALYINYNNLCSPFFANITCSAHRPKRYQLGELVDYFFRVMRKDKEWGYYRYDMRYDPLFSLKVRITSISFLCLLIYSFALF